MTKSKKTIFIVLAMLLAVVLAFTGCQPSKPSGDTGTVDPTPAPTTEATEEPPAEVVKEPETIIWYCGGGEQTGSQPVFEKLNTLLLEKYNIQLDFRTFDFGIYDEKMNMIISSGKDYDLCFTTQSWVNKYPVQVSKSAFLALDDYLPNYPALKEALPEFLFEQARIDGKIYAVPNYQITYSQWGYLFRKDLIDESGFDFASVKNYWDAEPFWQFVKDNHPDLYPTNAIYTQFQNVRNVLIPVDADAYFHRDDPTYKLSFYWDKEESMAAEFGAYYSGLQNRLMWEKAFYARILPRFKMRPPMTQQVNLLL